MKNTYSNINILTATTLLAFFSFTSCTANNNNNNNNNNNAIVIPYDQNNPTLATIRLRDVDNATRDLGNNTRLGAKVYVQKNIRDNVGTLRIDSHVQLDSEGLIRIDVRSVYNGGDHTVYSYSVKYLLRETQDDVPLMTVKVGPIKVTSKAHHHRKIYTWQENSSDCRKVGHVETVVTSVPTGCTIL